MAERTEVPGKNGPMRGKGGRRKGFASRNEINDMKLFDEDPGKEPTLENGKPPPKPHEHGEKTNLPPAGRH